MLTSALLVGPEGSSPRADGRGVVVDALGDAGGVVGVGDVGGARDAVGVGDDARPVPEVTGRRLDLPLLLDEAGAGGDGRVARALSGVAARTELVA